MKKFETLIIEVRSYVENNTLRKDIDVFFVQENRQITLLNKSEIDAIKEYNLEGYYISAMDSNNRQFVMTREID